MEVTGPSSRLSAHSHHLLSLPQLKTQTHETSIPALLFLEDAKTNYVRGFFGGELFYEVDSNPKPWKALLPFKL